MNPPFHVIIPARYHSTRFPGKLLEKLHGLTILERTYRQALAAKPQSITIATDHEAIFTEATQFGAKVMMTASEHVTGTDRIAEVVTKGKFNAHDIIVNVQGDEPLIAPPLIMQVAKALSNTHAPMSTLCWPIDDLQMLYNPNVVKVVRTKDHYALYFSRSAIPAHRDSPQSYANTYRHIGLYAYRAGFLLDFITWPVCELEVDEALEQLRVLWYGVNIKVEQACLEPLQDINTPKDLIAAQKTAINLS